MKKSNFFKFQNSFPVDIKISQKILNFKSFFPIGTKKLEKNVQTSLNLAEQSQNKVS